MDGYVQLLLHYLFEFSSTFIATINYRYADEMYEYRHVILPRAIAKKMFEEYGP